MNIEEKIRETASKIATLESEKQQAEQAQQSEKAASLGHEIERNYTELKNLQAEAEVYSSYDGVKGEPEAQETENVALDSTYRVVRTRGGNPLNKRSSIYDVADRMGTNETVTKVTTSVELDSTSKKMFENGVSTKDDLLREQMPVETLSKLQKDFERQHKQEEQERQRQADSLSAFVGGGVGVSGELEAPKESFTGSFSHGSTYEPEPEAAQSAEIDGKEYRFMEDGDRVNGEVVGIVEDENGSAFYAVEAVGYDWETEHVLVPVPEDEAEMHRVGEKIRANMQENEVSTRADHEQELSM